MSKTTNRSTTDPKVKLLSKRGVKMKYLLCFIVMLFALSSCAHVNQLIDNYKQSEKEEAPAKKPSKKPGKKPGKKPVPAPTSSETGTYWGRYNGNRPTWYFTKKMSSYPDTLYLTISGCASNLEVNNNGHRWESGGYIVKQSDVPGRGMAVVAPAACQSKTASITYKSNPYNL